MLTCVQLCYERKEPFNPVTIQKNLDKRLWSDHSDTVDKSVRYCDGPAWVTGPGGLSGHTLALPEPWWGVEEGACS